MVYDRAWEGKQLLNSDFTHTVQKETMPDNKNRVAFFYGPLLLAGDLGSIRKPVAAPYESVSDNKVSLPYLVGAVDIADLAKQSAMPSALATLPLSTKLVPFFNATERYVVYFDEFTEEEWKEREAKVKAEQERLLNLEKQTVDIFQPGEMQPERDHNFQGEKIAFGEAQGRKWRHASDGGSMTFDMKVNPDKKNKLVLTYWGGDSGNRRFDIIVNGKKIAEQRLENNVPGKFFDVEHLLDGEEFRGKDKISVMLKAQPGAFAGGLFGCRTMIVEE
jgi:hypothetical protein